MIMVTGGQCQGKLEFVYEYIKNEKMDISNEEIADGETDGFEAAFTYPVVRHLELYIRRIMEKGESVPVFVDRLLKDNKGAIVMTDEIGSGIVPIDPFEREYRETVGRQCQKLAAASETVFRVVMGIGIKIKG